ncbi:MAG: hypothetical protein EAZ95_08475 [Bacteroidetes bacterium]|nr:MAG: hypothetical protein EAZ95_08475 [Bacteroidota bacterium]
MQEIRTPSMLFNTKLTRVRNDEFASFSTLLRRSRQGKIFQRYFEIIELNVIEKVNLKNFVPLFQQNQQ